MDGVVAAFDEPRGLGTVDADGTAYPFHCTALLDGSRTVAVGTAVTFEVRAAGMGRWEATRIEAVSEP
jgi:cold shock CspA family protein